MAIEVPEFRESYQLFFDNSLDIIYVIDLQGDFIDANEVALNLFGYQREEILSITIKELMDEESAVKGKELIGEIIREGRQSNRLEFKVKTKSGETLYIETYGMPLKKDEEVFAILGIAHDVTEDKKIEVELRESEERFRLMAEQNLMGIVILQDDKLKYVNQATSEIGGYDIQEMLNWNTIEWVNIIFPDDLPFVLEQARKKQLGDDTGIVNRYSYRVITKDQKIKWVEQYSKTITFQGKPADFILLTDITERKKAELEIQESEKIFRELVELLPDIVFETDSNFKLTYVNQIGFEKFGYSHEEFLRGINILDSITLEETARASINIKKLYREGISGSGEYLMQTKDGGRFYATVNARPIYRNEKIVGMRGVIHDITESKEAEEKLKQSEEKYRYLFEKSPHSIVLMDLEGRLVDFNSMQEKTFGYNREDVIDTEFYNLGTLHPNSLPLAVEAFKKVLKGEGRQELEILYFRKGGGTIWGLTDGSLVEIGSETFIQVHIQDITEKKEAEEKLRESEQKYRDMITNLDLGYYMGEFKGELLMHNPAINNILGLDPSVSLIGSKSSDFFIYPNERKKYYEQLESKGFIKDFNVNVTKRDGKHIVLQLNSHTVEDKYGKIFVEGTISDITEKFRLEQKLKESEEKYRLISENINDLITIINSDFEIEYVNEFAHSKILDYSVDELIGSSLLSLIRPELVEDLKTSLNYCFNMGELLQEFEYKHANGDLVWFEVNWKCFVDPIGEEKIILISRDISERKEAEALLIESESKYRAIFEQAGDSIVLIDTETGGLIDFNDMTHKNLGYTREEFKNIKIPDFEIVESAEEVGVHYEKIIKEGFDMFETKHKRKDGEVRDIFVSSKYIRIREKDYIQAIFRDITERKKADQKLRESKEKYQNLINNIDDLLIEVDLNRVIVFISPQVRQILGYQPEEIIGLTAFELIHPDEELFEKSELINALQTGGPLLTEHRVRHKEGHYIQLAMRGNVIKKDNEIKIVGIFRDITAQKESKQKLKESEEKFRTITEQSLMGIGIVQDNIYKYINEQAANIFGYTPKEMKSWPPGDYINIIHPEQRPFAKENAERTQLGQIDETNQYEVRGIKKNGESIWLELYSKTINYQGKPAALATLIDVTDRKRAQDSLKKLTEELEEKVELRTRELKESEEKYRNMVNHLDVGFFHIDKNANILNHNYTLNELLGYERKRDLIGTNSLDLWVHAQKFEESMNSLMQTGTLRGYISEIKKADGETFVAQINAHTLLNKETKEIEIEGTISDITEKFVLEQKVKDSEERLRSLIDNAPNIIVTIDKEKRILSINRTIEGYTVEATIGTSIYDYIMPEYHEIANKVIDRVFNNDEPGDYETTIKAPNDILWFDTNVGPIMRDDQVVAVTLITTNITERKRAAEKLRESEERFRSLVETTSDWIWEVDHNAAYTYTSPKIKDLLGCEPAEIIGKTPFDLMPPDEAERVSKIFKALSESQEPFKGLENVNLRKDGERITLETSGVPIFDVNGNFKGYRGIDRDITDRKVAELKLKKSEEQFRHLFEMSPLSIMLVNSEGNIIDCNSMTVKLLGYKKEEIIGKGYLFLSNIFKTSELNPLFQERIKIVFQEGITKPIEVPCYVKDGKLIWVHLHSSLVELGDGSYIQVILHDITGQKKAEKKLRKSEERLRELNKELEAKVEERTKELSESEESFRRLSDNAFESICVHENGEILDANQATVDLFGYEYSELIRMNVLDLAAPESRELITQNILSGYEDPYEAEGIRKDGTKIIGEIRSKTIPFRGRTVRIASILDITERKQAEEEVRKTKDELDLILKSVSELISYQDRDLKIVWANAAAGESVNKLPEDLIGRHCYEIWEQRDSPCVSCPVLVSIETGQSQRDERTTPDGRSWIIRTAPVKDENGDIIGAVESTLEITERKKAEEKLKESEETYRTLVETSPDAITLTDLKGKIIQVSQKAVEFYGAEKPEDMIGLTSFDLLVPEDREAAANSLLNTLKEGSSGNLEYNFLRTDGSTYVGELNASLVKDAYGNPKAFIGTIRDVSDRKEAEKKLKESEEKLREQNIELKRLDQLKNDFITMAAHELKTPLVSIMGFTDFILANYKDLDSEIREDLTIVQKNSERLQRLINQLLDVLQIDAKKMDITKKPENIFKILDKNIKELSFQVMEKPVIITVDVPEDLKLNVDALRVSQIFSNLITNAIKYVSPGGSIIISAEKRATHYLFKIKDHGIGLSQEEIELLFNKFVRIEPSSEDSSERSRGFGLGLYIAKGLVIAHGGEIWVSSEGKGKGSEFYFTLPINEK